MPELPEVETIVRELRVHLPGKTIVEASLTAPDLYRSASASVDVLAGTRIESVERRGKAIVISLRPRSGRTEDRLVVHLGMTGRLEWSAPAQGRAGGAEPGLPVGLAPRGMAKRQALRARSEKKVHLHARWQLSDGSELRYLDPRRFGFILVATARVVDASLNIGPDPFEIDARALAKMLAGRRAPVKALLLDQRLVSGLGNIYVDEALHLARIHPLTTGDRAAKRAADILAAARRVLTRAIRARGTTFRDYRRTDGARGEFQMQLRVYGRDGDACGECGATIRRMEVSQRGTHYCPRCQRRPRVSSSARSRGDRSRRAGPRRAGYTRSR